MWHNLGRFREEIAAALGGFSGLFAAAAALALLVAVAAALRQGWRSSLGRGAWAAGACVLGGLISVAVYSAGGRTLAGLGIESRSFTILSFWMSAGGALAAVWLQRALEGRWRRLALAAACAGIAALGGANLDRISDWAMAWRIQQRVLVNFPVREVLELPSDTPVIVLMPRSYREAPISGSQFAISRQIEHYWPVLRGRTFLLVNPWLGPMVWDGAEIRQSELVRVPASRIAVYDWFHGRFFEPPAP